MTESPRAARINLFRKQNFLVVDNFENFRLSMRQMLRSCGAEKIELVAHATPAIRYCTYNHVDVVLCDYNLGEGKTGQHVLEELRYRKLLKRSSLFLIVTAETSRDIVMGAREYQPDGYLTKPINRAMLEKRLGALLQRRADLLPVYRALDRENYPEAVALIRRALPRQPRYKTWLIRTLGDLYIQLGDLSHALKTYDEVLAQREIPWARLGRCRVLLAHHQYEEASEALSQLIRKHPDYMEAYDLLAQALEKLGRPTRAQKVLEQATRHSPYALLRQRHLAEIATANQDLPTASQAWRQTVELGTWSIHDSASHYLGLARTLSDLADDPDSDTASVQADEAMEVLARMDRRFPDAETSRLQGELVRCRIHASQGREAQAEQLLVRLKPALGSADSITPELGLEYARTLSRLGHQAEARALLGTLAGRFADDPAILQEVENLLDEPVGFRQKLKARALNRNGIRAFENGDLSAAALAFRQALALVPGHAALNLNLVQVLLREYEQAPHRSELLHECGSLLDRLTGLPEQHRQYRRYKALQHRYEGLTS